MEQVKNIVIVGGGSAGWLTALAFTAPELVNKFNYNVTLIESKDISTIGVGESTQPLVTDFMNDAGFNVWDWMPRANATFKLGVLLDGWADVPSFVDSEDAIYHTLYNQYTMADIFLKNKLSAEQFNEWLEPYHIARENKSPLIGLPEKADLSNLDLAGRINDSSRISDKDVIYYSKCNDNPPWAVQWDQECLARTCRLKCLARSNFKLIQETINDISVDENNYVTSLKLTNGLRIEGDLFIDCSGFKRILLDKLCNVPWRSFNSFLPNNHALVVRKKYVNPQQECHPYTKATAMTSGWKWSIPTYDDISHGYVFCDRYIDVQDAEKELRSEINEWDAPVLDVPFIPGMSKKIAYNNVIGAGLSSAFVEPLEATSLAFTCLSIKKLKECLVHNNFCFDSDEINDSVNNEYYVKVEEITSFIFSHFKYAPKNDTLYWKDLKKIEPPPHVRLYTDELEKNPIHVRWLNKLSVKTMFHSGHWFQLLYPYGLYNDFTPQVPDHVNAIGKIYLERYRHQRTELLSQLDNHYDYLTKWYESS